MTNATDRLAGLLSRQEDERAALVAGLLDEERRAAAGIVDALHPDAGARLVEAIDQVERQIRQDHRADRLLARVVTQLPEWADRALPPVDPDDVDAGRKSVAIFIPRRYANGHIDPLALGLVDVTDAVYGVGSRRRRDQQAADDRVAEAGRDAEVQRDRAREAARR